MVGMVDPFDWAGNVAKDFGNVAKDFGEGLDEAYHGARRAFGRMTGDYIDPNGQPPQKPDIDAPVVNDAANDLPGRVIPEHWDFKSKYPDYPSIAEPVQQLNPGDVNTSAQNWRIAGEAITEGHDNFVSGVNNAASHGSKGKGPEAAQRAMKAYATELKTLSDQVQDMGKVMDYTGQTLAMCKGSMPPPQEYVNQMNSYDSASVQQDAKEQWRQFGVRMMNSLYNIPVSNVAQRAPLYSPPTQNPTTPTGDTASAPGGPDGSGGGDMGGPSGGGGGAPAGLGGGVPSGMGGGGSMGGAGGGGVPSGGGSAPHVPDMGKAPKVPGMGAPAAAGMNPLTSGLQQAAGMGQSALGQGQSAMSKLGELAKNPLGPPAGIHALGAMPKPPGGGAGGAGLAGLGKGAGGGGAPKIGGLGKGAGGAGGGAGAGASKLGALSRGLTSAEKASLGKGLQSTLDAEQSGASATRGATPTGAAPIGGARGAGAGAGQDKEHKANKFLQTTHNGEALLGTPPPVASPVIKDN